MSLPIISAIDLKKGDTVGDPELLITVADFDEKRFPNGYLVDDITWSSDLSSDFYMESLLSENNVYPGFGAAVNCHMVSKSILCY